MARKPKGYWTFEKVIDTARLYTSIVTWKRGHPSGHAAAIFRGWTHCIAIELGWRPANKPFRTIEECRVALKACGALTLGDWRKTHKQSHDFAESRLKHHELMAEVGGVIPNRWTYDKCLANARTSGATKLGQWQKTISKECTNAAHAAIDYKWTQRIATDMGWPLKHSKRCLEINAKRRLEMT